MPGEEERRLNVWGAGDDCDLALGDRGRRDRGDRRDDARADGRAARPELRDRACVLRASLDMIPNIGATIAGFILVPTLGRGGARGGDHHAQQVLLVYQQVENNVLTPKIQGKAVNLSGFFIIVAVTLFGALGVLGALTAVPARGEHPDLHPGADERATGEAAVSAKAALEPAAGQPG